jgi:hypothetical protein
MAFSLTLLHAAPIDPTVYVLIPKTMIFEPCPPLHPTTPSCCPGKHGTKPPRTTYDANSPCWASYSWSVQSIEGLKPSLIHFFLRSLISPLMPLKITTHLVTTREVLWPIQPPCFLAKTGGPISIPRHVGPDIAAPRLGPPSYGISWRSAVLTA